MKTRILVSAFLALAAGSLLFLLTACSPLNKLKTWVPFRDDGEKRYGLTNAEMDKFVSTIRSGQHDADYHYRLACFYQERRKHRFAIDEFTKTITIDPNHTQAYNGMGASYDLLGDFRRAAECYNAALEINPDLDYVHNNMGYSFLLQGDFDAAIDSFKKAVALDEKNERYHNNLGLAYGKKGQYELAFSEFKLAGGEAKARYKMARLFDQNVVSEGKKTYIAKGDDAKPSLAGASIASQKSEVIAELSKPEGIETLQSSTAMLLPDVDATSLKEETDAKLSAALPESGTEVEGPEMPVNAAHDEENLRSNDEQAHYAVQVGAHVVPEGAERVKEQLAKDGYDPYITKGTVEQKELYRVRVGRFQTKDEAKEAAKELETEEGLETYIVVEKTPEKELTFEDEAFQMAKNDNTVAVEIPPAGDGDRKERETSEIVAGAVRITYDDEVEKRIPAIQGPPKIIEAKPAMSIVQGADQDQEAEMLLIDSFEKVIDPGEAALSPAESEEPEAYIVAEETEPQDLVSADEDFETALREEAPAVSAIRLGEGDENALEALEPSQEFPPPTTDETWIEPSYSPEDAASDEIATLHEQESVTGAQSFSDSTEVLERREGTDEKQAREVISTEAPKQYSILFEFGKWIIHSDSEGTLKRIGETIRAQINPKVVISGHTDSKGSKVYNHTLSKKRAESVKRWLSRNEDINPEMVEVIAYGETKPVAPNANADGSDNPEGRSKNRRVDIMITKGEETFISYVPYN